MLTLEQVKEQTNKVFETEELTIPQPSLHFQRKLEGLEEAILENQRRACLFDMRCSQAKMLGFEQIESREMIEMLMGEAHTDEEDAKDRQSHEFFYNHHTEETFKGKACNWGGKPVQFYHMYKKNLWFLPPFNKLEKWRCQFGKLDYLKRDIPYGVVLRINEVKKLNLFNVFHVIAPMEAWERETDIDPIVTATIWEILKKEKGDDGSAGQVAHFFLAQW